MKQVQIPEFSIKQMIIPIVSISPLIVNAFSEKAKRMIEDKQQQKAKNKKHEIREPEQEYQAAHHKSPLGWTGFPAAGFKGALTRGAKLMGLTMKDVQTSFFVKADCEETQLVRIHGESRMRSDLVRIGMGTADVRYRPEYPAWYAELQVEFNSGLLSFEQIYQLVSAGGYFVGIGEMRPERTRFNFGRFKLANEQ